MTCISQFRLLEVFSLKSLAISIFIKKLNYKTFDKNIENTLNTTNQLVFISSQLWKVSLTLYSVLNITKNSAFTFVLILATLTLYSNVIYASLNRRLKDSISSKFPRFWIQMLHSSGTGLLQKIKNYSIKLACSYGMQMRTKLKWKVISKHSEVMSCLQSMKLKKN